MSPAQEMALIVTLAGLLGLVSAAAGVLWARSRSMPLIRAAQLARELAERQRALEDLIERLERSARKGREPNLTPGHPVGPSWTPSYRLDPAQASAVTGPTLIAVPDLSAPASEPPHAAVGAELASRFGDVWRLAERGDPAESIARETGQPIGQVELILGLRRQLASTSEGRP